MAMIRGGDKEQWCDSGGSMPIIQYYHCHLSTKKDLPPPLFPVTRLHERRGSVLAFPTLIYFLINISLTLEFQKPQTTWGSRDGADDYDAERMKKRTDFDRMKRPYYPNFITQ